MTGHDQVVLQVWILSLQLRPAAEVVGGTVKCHLSLRIIGTYDFTTQCNWKLQPLCATKKKCPAEVLPFNFLKELDSSYVLYKAANKC